jgi:hypothetical protein
MDDEDRLNDVIGEIERIRAEMRLDLAIQEIVKLAEVLRRENPPPPRTTRAADDGPAT